MENYSLYLVVSQFLDKEIHTTSTSLEYLDIPDITITTENANNEEEYIRNETIFPTTTTMKEKYGSNNSPFHQRRNRTIPVLKRRSRQTTLSSSLPNDVFEEDNEVDNQSILHETNSTIRRMENRLSESSSPDSVTSTKSSSCSSSSGSGEGLTSNINRGGSFTRSGSTRCSMRNSSHHKHDNIRCSRCNKNPDR